MVPKEVKKAMRTQRTSATVSGTTGSGLTASTVAGTTSSVDQSFGIGCYAVNNNSKQMMSASSAQEDVVWDGRSSVRNLSG